MTSRCSAPSSAASRITSLSTSTGSPKTMKPEASQGVCSDHFEDRSDDDLAAQKQNANAPHRDGFPKSALLLVDALKKNRACMKFMLSLTFACFCGYINQCLKQSIQCV